MIATERKHKMLLAVESAYSSYSWSSKLWSEETTVIIRVSSFISLLAICQCPLRKKKLRTNLDYTMNRNRILRRFDLKKSKFTLYLLEWRPIGIREVVLYTLVWIAAVNHIKKMIKTGIWEGFEGIWSGKKMKSDLVAYFANGITLFVTPSLNTFAMSILQKLKRDIFRILICLKVKITCCRINWPSSYHNKSKESPYSNQNPHPDKFCIPPFF